MSNDNVSAICPLRRLAEQGIAFLDHQRIYSLGIVTNKTTLNRWISSGRFPRPFYVDPVSQRSPRWTVESVIAWRDAMVSEAANDTTRPGAG